MPGEDGGASGGALNLFHLLDVGRILAYGLHQKFGVDLDDGEEIIELVGDETCRLVGFLEIVCSRRQVRARGSLDLAGVACALFQDYRPRSSGTVRTGPIDAK